jgi:4-hydroxybenzoate polyprenyltransferase
MFYAAFSFAGNLLREIVKDLEDVEGDGRHGARTLPVVRGVAWGKRAAFVLLAGLAALVVAFLVQAGTWGWGAGIVWGVAFLLAPLAVVLVLLIRADGTRDYRRVSTAVKGLMLAGLLYLPFVSTVPLAWWALPSG